MNHHGAERFTQFIVGHHESISRIRQIDDAAHTITPQER
jgi:hypothetical protein